MHQPGQTVWHHGNSLQMQLCLWQHQVEHWPNDEWFLHIGKVCKEMDRKDVWTGSCMPTPVMHCASVQQECSPLHDEASQKASDQCMLCHSYRGQRAIRMSAQKVLSSANHKATAQSWHMQSKTSTASAVVRHTDVKVFGQVALRVKKTIYTCRTSNHNKKHLCNMSRSAPKIGEQPQNQIMNHHVPPYDGFHSHGGTPIAGWFIVDNPI